MTKVRKIIHVDMDAFYAAVEQRDNPTLRGKAIVVGGRPDSRGVVATASYEARKFGVHSAMSCAQAYRLCPQAIFVPPRFESYREVSLQIMEIFRGYTDLVEPLSLDEAFLDVTTNKFGIEYASVVAKRIKQEIVETTQLTASAGVAPNKFLAKIASDMNKPDGLTIIVPENVEAVLETLPVRKVPGIGRVTEHKMNMMGILTTKDLRARSEEELVGRFGKSGRWYYKIARGEDFREVKPERVRKSVGAEDTFPRDLIDIYQMQLELAKLAEKVSTRLGKKDYRGRTITLKVTFNDFEKITRSKTLEEYVNDQETLESIATTLLIQSEATERPVRLLGISVSNLEHAEADDRLNEPDSLQLEFEWGMRS